jgi:hypothetical protein
LDKLKENEYITIQKDFKNKYPVTRCRITKKGILAFEDYVETLKQYLDIKKLNLEK